MAHPSYASVHRSLKLTPIGVLVALQAITLAGVAGAQVTTAQAKPSLKQIGLMIYPAKGQTPGQQAKDEEACTTWAEQQTGLTLTGGQVNVDSAAQAAGQKAEEATRGAAVVGAARGAAGGAAVGAISGDAGKGAAIGAVAGAMGGRRARKQAEKQAEAQGGQQAQVQSQQRVEQFKKAAGACLEGRGYTVR